MTSTLVSHHTLFNEKAYKQARFCLISYKITSIDQIKLHSTSDNNFGQGNTWSLPTPQVI